MNIQNYEDIKKYLQYKQVYFKREIADSGLVTIFESGKVHDFGNVQIRRLSEEVVAFTIECNGLLTTLFEYKSDLELFAWVKTTFIPVQELVKRYNILD